MFAASRVRIFCRALLFLVVALLVGGCDDTTTVRVPGSLPDFPQLAFSMTDTPAGPNLDIWLMNVDGTELQNLTGNPQLRNLHPTWAPGGKRIAFYSRSSGANRTDVYAISADGTHRVNLTNNPAVFNYQPSWSPAFTSIAFTVDNGEELQIWTMNPDGFNKRMLRGGLSSTPAWSRDGTRIAFTGGQDGQDDIWIMNADGSNPVNVTNTPGISESAPSWSPDGTMLVFDTAVDDDVSDIFAINVDGTNRRNLTGEGQPDDSNVQPAWSPDGTTIAFIQNGELWLMNPDGSNKRLISPIENRVYRNPSWNPAR